MASSAQSVSSGERVAALRARIDKALPAVVDGRAPASLYDAVEHVLRAGGKRVRPILLLLVAESYGTSVDRALPAALAVEVFHNFTLVHDDLMDEDDERRGGATVHTKWDSGTAILTGDLMMGLSYDLLGQVDGTDAEALYAVYHPMVEKLCAGQALDASFETDDAVTVEAYLDMIDRKTGALLSAAFELGGIIGGAPAPECDRLGTAGRLVGRAFQIQDDLLDLIAEDEEWGRGVGGDLVRGKKTFLTLCALERADGADQDWVERLVADGGLSQDDVPKARARMADLGVFEEARAAVRAYTEKAYDHLHLLPDTGAAEALHWFLDRLQAREH
ncbi:polyprenyl synthetase family protein [Salinibacter altiplanensis]|uniref:polyprenyl synthetase family protein n=1 Tax=Salinibacter altiplanensis TaxID=1803181 RepID=UPI000C9F6B22|nr:polyprenyl synthetase family protein [Salinibacter altiplanensis]